MEKCLKSARVPDLRLKIEAQIWNTENQNYNFAGKKEECVTWHFKDVFEIYQGTSRPP